jgi:hypothetical protein
MAIGNTDAEPASRAWGTEALAACCGFAAFGFAIPTMVRQRVGVSQTSVIKSYACPQTPPWADWFVPEVIAGAPSPLWCDSPTGYDAAVEILGGALGTIFKLSVLLFLGWLLLQGRVTLVVALLLGYVAMWCIGKYDLLDRVEAWAEDRRRARNLRRAEAYRRRNLRQ